MLSKQASDLTSRILTRLQVEKTTYSFITIQPIILQAFESIYIHARDDADNCIEFLTLEDGHLQLDE